MKKSVVILLILVFSVSLVSVGLFSDFFGKITGKVVSEEGLIAHYKFEDNVQDSIGSNHGTNTGASFVNGMIERGLNLEGNVNVGLGNIDLGEEFTISAWVNRKTQTGINFMGVIDKLGRWETGYSISAYPGWEGLSFIGYTSQGGWFNLAFGSENKDEWYHVTAVYNHGIIKSYTNGQISNTLDRSGETLTKNNLPLKLGVQGEDYFNGFVDELKIWNKALSDSEIEQEYNRAFCDCFSGACCDGCNFKSSETICGTKNCDLFDTECREFSNINKVCSGETAACPDTTCNEYTNKQIGTSCGDKRECDGFGNCIDIIETPSNITENITSSDITPLSNAIEVKTQNLVFEDKCLFAEYTNSDGIKKSTYLDELPLLPWGIDTARFCLPKEIPNNFKIKSTTSGFEEVINLGSESEQRCTDFVTNVYDYPDLFAIAGDFTEEELIVEISPINSNKKITYINTNPRKLYRNTYSPVFEFTDDYDESDKRILLVFEKPENYVKNYEITVKQGSNEIWLGVPNWNCPEINEAPELEINVWAELRKDTMTPSGYENNNLENINFDLINSQKFKNDMQQLYDSGINTLTIYPQTNIAEQSSLLFSKDHLLYRYEQMTSAISDGINGEFNFVVQLNHFPRFYNNGSRMGDAWYPFRDDRDDIEIFNEIYSYLSFNLKNDLNFKGIMPWQEATGVKIPKTIQEERINIMKESLEGTNKKIYGFDGWVMCGKDIYPEWTSPETDCKEINYLTSNFGDVFVHQTFPGNGRLLPNNAPAIQDSVDGLRFWFRGLTRQGRKDPVNVIAYLQSFNKGQVNCPGTDYDDASITFDDVNYNTNWKMQNELDAQRAAIKFYSDKYNLPATFSGATFYYYGNYYDNAGKDHIWWASDWEKTQNKPTDCWPRIDNNQEIFNEVIDVARYLTNKEKIEHSLKPSGTIVTQYTPEVDSEPDADPEPGIDQESEIDDQQTTTKKPNVFSRIVNWFRNLF
tara:strand:- start:752 stop:3685 length:2934 start_codon:yes stop_codon:yes gene_type:complete